ncbi:hypothetical protein HaLaN_21626 [Haematococcus lacustris]|uniref:Uncharacterized protein n=1 Tax=Haematococcus lacustris TaxID=44745 RepID=A0A699ZM75_HAELA|nr:hypothetical protein HaLaN_21626 [Haematococcus lacustris]
MPLRSGLSVTQRAVLLSFFVVAFVSGPVRCQTGAVVPGGPIINVISPGQITPGIGGSLPQIGSAIGGGGGGGAAPNNNTGLLGLLPPTTITYAGAIQVAISLSATYTAATAGQLALTLTTLFQQLNFLIGDPAMSLMLPPGLITQLADSSISPGAMASDTANMVSTNVARTTATSNATSSVPSSRNKARKVQEGEVAAGEQPQPIAGQGDSSSNGGVYDDEGEVESGRPTRAPLESSTGPAGRDGADGSQRAGGAESDPAQARTSPSDLPNGADGMPEDFENIDDYDEESAEYLSAYEAFTDTTYDDWQAQQAIQVAVGFATNLDLSASYDLIAALAGEAGSGSRGVGYGAASSMLQAGQGDLQTVTLPMPKGDAQSVDSASAGLAAASGMLGKGPAAAAAMSESAAVNGTTNSSTNATQPTCEWSNMRQGAGTVLQSSLCIGVSKCVVDVAHHLAMELARMDTIANISDVLSEPRSTLARPSLGYWDASH